ncbi:transposase [Pseudomonas sp. SWRI124]|nr:transposase [Pseudomonas khavaziana]
MSDTKQTAKNWSAESKLAIIIEAGSLSELEIGEYCRRKGIFPEQITDWRNAFIAGSTKQSTPKIPGRSTRWLRRWPRQIF